MQCVSNKTIFYFWVKSYTLEKEAYTIALDKFFKCFKDLARLQILSINKWNYLLFISYEVHNKWQSKLSRFRKLTHIFCYHHENSVTDRHIISNVTNKASVCTPGHAFKFSGSSLRIFGSFCNVFIFLA